MSDDTLTMCTDVYPLPRGIDNLRSVDTGVYATRGDQISMRKFLSTVYASSGRPGRSGWVRTGQFFCPFEHVHTRRRARCCGSWRARCCGPWRAVHKQEASRRAEERGRVGRVCRRCRAMSVKSKLTIACNRIVTDTRAVPPPGLSLHRGSPHARQSCTLPSGSPLALAGWPKCSSASCTSLACSICSSACSPLSAPPAGWAPPPPPPPP